jgi:3-phosphoshikimate 1-carboxyvinyltransferase
MSDAATYTAIISPSNLQGSITAPTSKSSMQRACAAALLHHGTTTIHNAGFSNDDKAAIDVIQQLGATINFEGEKLIINSQGVAAKNNTIHLGESGLGVRMFTPIAALSPQKITINGAGSLLQRPVDFFDEVMPKLKVAVTSNQGKLPLIIQGPLQPQPIAVDGSLSSQFLTGLLMAYAYSVNSDTTIKVNNLTSKPYIDLTLAVLHHFGYKITNNNYQSFTIHPKTEVAHHIDYNVESDWSGAAFLLVAAVINGNCTINNLGKQSTQADKAILAALEKAGATLNWDNENLSLAATPLKAFEFDATECPDLFPPLVALASYCQGTTIIKGTNRLTHKESNRALTLQQEFAKLGVPITLTENTMHIVGNGTVQGGKVSSCNDHRIAMACAVAALGATSAVHISNAEAINKSYPNFFTDIENLGAAINIIT